jgi:hypothetical protein
MKPKKLSPFDHIKSINQKVYMEDLSGFVPFITMMNYSAGSLHYCFLANALNKIGMHRLPKRMIYDFFFYAVPKNSKWLKYPKKQHDEKDVKYLQEWFECDEKSARTSLEIIDKDELKEIREFFESRGFIK